MAAYRSSYAVQRWLGERRAAIDTLALAHAQIGELDGPGRPLEIGRPIAHAYVVRVVAEFQAFVRDLHDLAADAVATGSGAANSFVPLLVAAATEGRLIDRGNADLRSLQSDFKRLGIQSLSASLQAANGYWATSKELRRRGDAAYYGDLIQLRNALAHGNQTQLDRLRREGTRDTVPGPGRGCPASIALRVPSTACCGIICGQRSERIRGHERSAEARGQGDHSVGPGRERQRHGRRGLGRPTATRARADRPARGRRRGPNGPPSCSLGRQGGLDRLGSPAVWLRARTNASSGGSAGGSRVVHCCSCCHRPRLDQSGHHRVGRVERVSVGEHRHLLGGRLFGLSPGGTGSQAEPGRSADERLHQTEER